MTLDYKQPRGKMGRSKHKNARPGFKAVCGPGEAHALWRRSWGVLWELAPMMPIMHLRQAPHEVHKSEPSAGLVRREWLGSK